MRRSREEAAKTRRDIVEAASRLFRKRGIANVSIADVMGSIGHTIGGFYRHFEDKDALVAEAIHLASKNTVASGTLAELLDRYLSKEHRSNAEGGCPVAALCSEIGREGRMPRRAFTEAVTRMIDATASGRRDRTRQLAMLAQAVGGLVLSRAVDDPKLSDEILSAVRGDLLATTKR